MNSSFEKAISMHIDNERLIDQMIVTMFVKSNGIEVLQNELIKGLLLHPSELECMDICSISVPLSFEQLIEAFEVAVPTSEKQVNGAVYTPKIIKDFIIQHSLEGLLKPVDTLLGADISCGCGAFLYSLAVSIHSKTGKSIQSIIKSQLFGLDISGSSIRRAKIVLALLALSHGEDEAHLEFNLFTANALDFDWKTNPKVKANDGFDLIVGNPPYVRAKHIDECSKRLLKKWQVTKSGNPDLYIPFFEIGLRNLNQDGVLGYITVNSFYRSVNARSLRTYFDAFQISLKIIDFGHEQIFADKLTYTCICFLTKQSSPILYFAKASLNSLTKLQTQNFTEIPYRTLNAHIGWLLNIPREISNVQKIERCGTPLGKLFSIKNGIATLSNDTYIFKPTGEDSQFYFFEKGGKRHQVEKGICRDIIKPNILKYEHEISAIKEKLIYPYTNGSAPLSLMKEDFFRGNFPDAYQYLWEQKEQLSLRDKGNGEYAAWYAYGRSQALNDKGLKLLFPYMASRPYFVFTDQEDMLIYCGYAIFSDSKEELLVLKKLLESSLFDYYMRSTSKPYASGYYSYAKNYVKNFGVCTLTESEKQQILQFETATDVDAFFLDKYEIKW